MRAIPDNIFGKTIGESSDSLLFFPSFTDMLDVRRRPVFFYHLQKTGGTSLFAVLRFAHKQFMNSYPDKSISKLSLGRLDSVNTVSDFTRQDYLFYASHLPFGIHLESTRQNPDLITFVRDPYLRVKSLYTYRCMRAQTHPTEQGFKQFIESDMVHNYQVKQLGLENTDHDYYRQVLDSQFYAFAPDSMVNYMTSVLLSQFGFASTLTERLNETVPEYQLDSDCYEAEVRSLNAKDEILFTQVAREPKLPAFNLTQENRLHPDFMALKETEKVTSSEVLSITYPVMNAYNYFKAKNDMGMKMSLDELLVY